MPHETHSALPPPRSQVIDRDQHIGIVLNRSGRECLVKFADGSVRAVFANQLTVLPALQAAS